MGPRFFGADDELFGWYHAPASPTRAIAVVVCGGHGDEYLCSHRALRALALRLSSAGFPVLRFDYHGSGESIGSDRDPGRVAAWRASVHAAIDELKSETGLDVAIVGLRLGAMLAAHVAAERTDVVALALWAPNAKGQAYLREQKALHMMAKEAWVEKEDPNVRGPNDGEYSGFFVSAETNADLRRLDFSTLAKKPADDVLLLGRDDTPPDEALVTKLTALGSRVVVGEGAGYGELMRAPHASIIPEKTFTTIHDWLLSIRTTEAPQSRPRSPARQMTDAGHARRAALNFGPAKRLFGVLTEPPSTDRSRPAVVMMSIGANHTVGAAAHYPRLAGALAAIGYTSLRFDLSGIGESKPAPGEKENFPYPDCGVDDVKAAMEELRRRGHERFVLMGLCSGGYHAFRAAAVSDNVVGVVAMNSQTFAYEGEPLDVHIARWRSKSRADNVMQSAKQLDKWKRLVTGKVNVRRVAQLLFDRGRQIAEARVTALVEQYGPATTKNFGKTFERLCNAGTKVLLVYTSNDPGLDYIRHRMGRRLEKLRRHEHFRMIEIAGPDHTFTPLWAQAELERAVVDHFTKTFGASAVTNTPRHPAQASRASRP